MIFFDTETCGLHGFCVLIQYAYGESEIFLHDVMYERVEDTLELIEDFCEYEEGVCGFNLAFDWFHMQKMYNVLSLVEDKKCYPIDIIPELASLETKALDGVCIKPQTALDLMIHARKGEFQATMDRKDIRIKRIPSILADALCDELCQRVHLDSLYFSRRKDDSIRWQIQDIEDEPDFKDIVLKFAPSAALKTLAKFALGVDPDSIKKFADVDVPAHLRPTEIGWAPYAYGEKPWTRMIRYHAEHWRYSPKARQYAEDDVTYTRGLYNYFKQPEAGDDDSVLACMVASCRWRGYEIDHAGIKTLRDEGAKKLQDLPFNPHAPSSVIAYMTPNMSELEKESMRINGKWSTKKQVLEGIAKWRLSDICPDCEGMGCNKCDEGLIDLEDPHPVAEKAQEVLNARMLGKEIELYDKLLQAKRFHASFKVVGTLSGRMAGADGLNAQGIKRETHVREKFGLALPGMVLGGGDFDGFEVTIADAVYADPELRKALQSGKKIHGLFGVHLFPHLSYDEILASKGEEIDYYTRSKNGVFALFYGGEAYTLSNRVGVPEDVANTAYHNFVQDFEVLGKKRTRISNQFCSMQQPDGIGTRVVWETPDDYIESIFGFRRYFTLENRICKALFDLAEDPPKAWNDFKVKVKRRDRLQMPVGAVRSALFASAFAQQGSNMRAAGNHVIQSAGATLTKILQRRLWDLQPTGINSWVIQPLNVHDEVMAPMIPDAAQPAAQIVESFVEEYRNMVPLLSITWASDLPNWADKT